MSTGSFFIQRQGAEHGPLQMVELQAMARSGQVTAMTLVRTEGGQWFPIRELDGVFSNREWLTALLLSLFLGTLGIDRFYLGYTGLGILKLLTIGGCGIWHLIDLILIAVNSLKDADGMPLKKL